MGDSRQKGPSFRGRGLNPSPLPGLVETVGLAPEVDQLLNLGLSTKVVETILNFRTPSIRKLYPLKWVVFISWCWGCWIDPVNFPVGSVLEFSEWFFFAGLSPSPLKVCVCGSHSFLPHSIGWWAIGEKPTGAPFPAWCFEAESCKPCEVSGLGFGSSRMSHMLENTITQRHSH